MNITRNRARIDGMTILFGLLALQAFDRRGDSLFERIELRGVAAAEPFDFHIALLPRQLAEPNAKIALRLGWMGIGF